MKYLYFCKKCYFFGSAEHTHPEDKQICPQCGSDMNYMGINKEEWDANPPQEKDRIKAEFIAAAQQVQQKKTESAEIGERVRNFAEEPKDVQLLRQAVEHLQVIRKCVVFFTALTVIGMVIALISALAAAIRLR